MEEEEIIKSEVIKIRLDDLIHDPRALEIVVNDSIVFIEALQKENQELREERDKWKQDHKDLVDIFIKEADKHTKLKEQVKQLEEGINSGIESLKSKHKSFLGTQGQECRDSFKNGLSWGWGAFEQLLNKNN